MRMAVFASLREVTMVAGLGRWLTQSGVLASLAPFIRPNLPDTGDLIRQLGMQDQA
jgi:hypothetical protein